MGGTTEGTHYPITDTCGVARLGAGAGAARLSTGGTLAGEAGGRSRGALNRALAGASSPAFRLSPYRALATAWRRALAISRVCTGGSRYGGAGQARRPDPRTRTAARRAGNGRSQGAGAGAGKQATDGPGALRGLLRASYGARELAAAHALSCMCDNPRLSCSHGQRTGGGQCHVGAPLRHANKGPGVMTSSGRCLWWPFFMERRTAWKPCRRTSETISGASS